jgi:hypothetical protein
MAYKYLILSILIFFIFSNPSQAQSLDPEQIFDLLPKYKIERETYPQKGKIIEIMLNTDTLAQITDITNQLNNVLDYVPPVYKIESGLKKIEGWRVQIYRGRSREEASKARQKCYEIFPNITPYMIYSAPTYRVRVGDFLEPHEYQIVLKRLKKEFPMVVAVPDIINIIVSRRDPRR